MQTVGEIWEGENPGKWESCKCPEKKKGEEGRDGGENVMERLNPGSRFRNSAVSEGPRGEAVSKV